MEHADYRIMKSSRRFFIGRRRAGLSLFGSHCPVAVGQSIWVVNQTVTRRAFSSRPTNSCVTVAAAAAKSVRDPIFIALFGREIFQRRHWITTRKPREPVDTQWPAPAVRVLLFWSNMKQKSARISPLSLIKFIFPSHSVARQKGMTAVPNLIVCLVGGEKYANLLLKFVVAEENMKI